MANNDTTSAETTATPAEAALPIAPQTAEYVPSAEGVLPTGLDGLVGADPEAGPEILADGKPAAPFEPLGAITNHP
ncbi:hypothetical protein [Kitasatospora sp. NBC_00315]|uniref:hypothetical protein n=1 Tax=Kitasatospora sp. NBC_00315 TaxID=2975963 RepID=UPI0032473FBC